MAYFLLLKLVKIIRNFRWTKRILTKHRESRCRIVLNNWTIEEHSSFFWDFVIETGDVIVVKLTWI